VPASSREQVQRDIHDRVARVIGWLQSEQHCEEVGCANQALAEKDRREPLDDAPLEERERLLEGLFKFTAELRRFVSASLDDQQHLAWQLGGLVDQGLCPPNVYRHLDGTSVGE